MYIYIYKPNAIVVCIGNVFCKAASKRASSRAGALVAALHSLSHTITIIRFLHEY